MKTSFFAGGLISLSVALVASSTLAQTVGGQSSGTLLVANQKDHTLSLIDAASARQVATIQENRITGHEVATSPDGRHRISTHLRRRRSR